MLAAGGGSRFGGGKLLAELGGRPIIEAVFDNLGKAPVDEIIAIVGADAKRLRGVCERYGVKTVANEEWSGASPRRSSPDCGRVVEKLR